MSTVSAKTRDELAKRLAGGRDKTDTTDVNGITPASIYASCATMEPEALVLKSIEFQDAVREIAVRAKGERDAALSRANEAEEARDLALGDAPAEHSALERTFANSAASAAERDMVSAGYTPEQAKSLKGVFLGSDGLPSDLGLSMVAGTTDPLMLRVMQWAATNKPLAGPELGRRFYAEPNPADAAASQSGSGMPTEERRKEMVDVAMRRKEYVPAR
jgi:hypothetical protein